MRGAKCCHIDNKIRVYLARLSRNRGRLPIRSRRGGPVVDAARVPSRGAAPAPWHDTSFRSQSRNMSPKNAIFCPSLPPPSEPILRSLQRAADRPLAGRGSSSQVFDLACFVGDDRQRRERRMRIFSLLFPDDREFPDDAGRPRPFFATLAARHVEARPRRRGGCARGTARPHTSRSRAKRAFF